MSDHTPEPWRQERASKSLHPRSYQRVITDADYEYIIAELFQFGEEDPREANARRIVACVNACAGIPSERLEQENDLMDIFGHMHDERAELTALRQQVADLRAALEDFVDECLPESEDERKEWREEYEGETGWVAPQIPFEVITDALDVLAATQPQEVQP